MSVQQFCLRWNNHQPNFISVCSSLLHNGTLVDVTLAAEGRQLQAHKIVLSACSSYFQTLFTTNPCQHPIVILKDVQYDDLKTMVDFMYYGEVNVSQEQLPHILKTAEMLKIKGLAEMPTDAATLTKSESKSSSEQPDQLQSSGSGTDSLWGSSESQFQQQQPQHHHHHHHQQSQTQQLHQLRRTPSPLGAGTSPATRRKRLRKSSNNGSGDRTSDEHGVVDAGANINLSQMSQMSFGGNTTGLGHTLHTKIIKESASVDVEAHQQDSSPDSLDDGHGHPHTMQIKPETDMSVPQTLPLDISGGTTPSEHDGPNASCSQSQSSHSGLQWTVVDSNYSRFSLSSCQANLIGNGNTNNPNNPNGNGGLSNQSNNNQSNNGNQNPGDHQQQQQQQQQQQHRQQQQNANNSNGNSSAAGGGNNLGNPQQQQGHIQMHYQNSTYSPQIISVNSLVGSYSQNLSTPTSPNESAMVQSVYSQGPTPTQSPVHQMNTVPSGLASASGAGGGPGTGNGASSSGGPNSSGNGTSLGGSGTSVVNTAGNSATGVGSNSQVQSGSQTTQTTTVKRKRSVNPQGDENFIRALEAVRSGGIGFCKAARLYGVNNRTLWLEYKKRGYPISRPSIKSRVVKQENLSPSPTPTNEETTIENYEHINQSAINMQVPPTSDTPTPLMCTPHHPMSGVMGFLDTRHMEFPGSIHTMARQRYVDGAVNVNPAAMNLQSINFNSI